MCVQSPWLSPFETLCRQGARNALGSLPPKQSPANMRATPLASIRLEHSATNVGVHAGGGRSGHLAGGRRLEHQPQRAQEEERTDGGQRTERS
jgi:hypothetical protein